MQLDKSTYFEQIVIDICDCCGTSKGYIDTYFDLNGENEIESLPSECLRQSQICDPCLKKIKKDLLEVIVTDCLEQGLKLELERSPDELEIGELLNFIPNKLASIENVTFGIGQPKHYRQFIAKQQYDNENVTHLASNFYAKTEYSKIWILDDDSYILEAI